VSLSGDSPRYNEWIVARSLTVAGFATDPDWRATQARFLPDAAGNPVTAFQIPPWPGRPGSGLKVLPVAVDAGGAPVAPGAGTITVELIEVVRYSGEYDDLAVHVADISTAFASTPTVGAALAFNTGATIAAIGGSQNQFALRVTALSAPAGAVTVRLLAAPLGGA